MDTDRCKECSTALYDEIERDVGVCNYCSERMYENECARRAWREYHDEPMPRSEIPNARPLRKRRATKANPD